MGLKDKTLFKTSTVKELEDLDQKMLDEKTGRKNQAEAARNPGTGEKPNKAYAHKVKRSDYPDNLVIMYRDSIMHDKMIAKFESQISSDEGHTRERLAELRPGSGVIVLRTNYASTGKAM